MGPNQALDIDATFQKGLLLHKQGQLEQAKVIYEEVLSEHPHHFDALHLLGVIANQTNNRESAVDLISRAIAINPNYAAAHSNIGLAFQELNQFEKAIASYDRAIEIQPDFSLAYYNRGNSLQRVKRFDEAIESYKRSIDISPDYPEAHCNLAIAFQELKRYEESIESFDKAIAINPKYAEAYSNSGVSFKELKRLDEAVARYKLAIEINPDYAEAYSNLSVALHDLKRFQEALENCDRAISLKPDFSGAHYNRGLALQGLNFLKEALDSYDRAIAIAPDYAQAYCNRGVVLQDLRDLKAAIASYNRASELNPNYPSAYWNKSVALLLSGDLINGWPLYEWRWTPELTTSTIRHFKQPLWIGNEDIKGKTILLHCEQGVGDSIQFCRYTKLVHDLGASVILEAPKSLVGLFNHLAGVDEIIEAGQSLPAFDYHCPLMSLPLAFGTELATIPQSKAYLSSEVEHRKTWIERLGVKTKPRIGVVWSGSTTHRNDRNRSLTLAELIKHMPSEFEYVSLQKEVRAIDQDVLGQSDIKHFGNQIKDFRDTAALCDLMDIVISVDTSVAHLSAAIGKETWVLLPFVPDWRWLLDRDDTPWYACVTLIRQDQNRDWETVLKRVAEKLSNTNPCPTI